MEGVNHTIQEISSSSVSSTTPSQNTSVQVNTAKKEGQSQDSTQSEIIDLSSQSRSDSSDRTEEELRTKRNRDIYDAGDKSAEPPKRRKV